LEFDFYLLVFHCFLIFSFAMESTCTLSQLESDVSLKRVDWQAALERHKTLLAEAKAAPTRDERDGMAGHGSRL
jgi:hypothetical protein